MIVIKFGGHAMTDEHGDFAVAIADAISSGVSPVVVHGGGPQIGAALKAAGISSNFVGGFRVTTPEIMKVVEMVLTGTVLRDVVRSLRQAGLPAVGIAGSDATLLEVQLKDEAKFGLVGSVSKVNPKILNDLLDMGYLPVVSPVSNDPTGQALNINADIAAGAIAGSLRADQMLFMTDVAGIYSKWPDQNTLIREISVSQLQTMNFTDGMVPKVEAAINAIEAGAKSARVFDGTSIDAFVAALEGRGGTWVKA